MTQQATAAAQQVGAMVSPKGGRREIAPGVERISTGLSNAYMVASRARGWVLVDAGSEGYVRRVSRAVRERFGEQPPEAVVLTHGHFDHAGGLPGLLMEWDTQVVYGHRLEKPYLNRHVEYPPGDPTVGGFMAQVSRLMNTRRPTDLPVELRQPAMNGEIAELPGWRWLHTPGHTPGHISLFDEETGTLLAGDAITTLNTDSMVGSLGQWPEISHPPAYATYDWGEAERSVEVLAALKPRVIGAGHGPPLAGEHVAEELRAYAAAFRPPLDGRYVRQAVVFDEEGPVEIPPPNRDVALQRALILGGVMAGVYLLGRKRGRR